MKTREITEMKINDQFMVEYGDYENWVTAVIKDIRPTEYDHIKIVDYTVPKYRGDHIFTKRMLYVKVREI